MSAETIPTVKEKLKKSIFLPKTPFPMRANLQRMEPKIIDFWDKIDLYKTLRQQSAGRAPFTLLFGPPYANGAIHIGHVLSEGLKDIVNKSKQMEGFDAPLIPGWDCHGLPIEWKVEEGLRENGVNKDDIPVADFIQKCRDFASRWVNTQRDGFIRLGMCADWKLPYITMDFKSEGAIVDRFLKVFMDGYIYRGKKPVLWSVVEQTALAEAEVEYKDHVSSTIYVAFKVKSSKVDELRGAACVIWTTTPWTLPANRAICFNKDFTYTLIVPRRVEQAGGEPSANNTAKRCVSPENFIGRAILVGKDLLPTFCHNIGLTAFDVVREIAGEELTGTICAHPFADALSGNDSTNPQIVCDWGGDIVLIHGDHVTADTGTGLVHTAPSHGVEDFEVCKACGIEGVDIVNGDGRYVADLPLFGGQHIFQVANNIIKALQDFGTLIASAELTHSYPHSWRSKTPLIYRLTSQWFMSIDMVREGALSAIEKVRWIPKQSINRIRGMVKDRADWCLSRQRVWGVPLTLLLDKETKEPLRDATVNQKIIATIEQEGIAAWHKYDADFFVPEHLAGKYEKVMDTLDVWFDSACASYFVLERREELNWPADLFLEGYDQHRGWFQSSLMLSIATKHAAPYKSVMSHGFILDQNGLKMSKSLGNVISSEDLIAEHGADLARLWIVSVDTEDDVRIGKQILVHLEDVYRRFRNTLRYLLGGISDFCADFAGSRDDMPELERYVLHLICMMEEKRRRYTHDFSLDKFYSELHTFCSNDLSAFYFDIRKDSLYCDARDSKRRRAAQFVMYTLFQYIVRWLAPVLSFTTEEAWQCYAESQKVCGFVDPVLGSSSTSSTAQRLRDVSPALNSFCDSACIDAQTGCMDNSAPSSIHTELFLTPDEHWFDDALYQKWSRIRTIRRVIMGAIEQFRQEKKITSSLQATASVFVGSSDAGLLDGVDPAEIAIVSRCSVIVGTAPENAFTLPEVANVGVVVAVAPGEKCQRCWRIVEGIHRIGGSQEATEDGEIGICDRCAEVYFSQPDEQ
ncbi:MAG: isoleucine--tRNA ligase [Holosporales bacterium]|jgi:isoleucyl-tRNA synthetase|nr:isoleucine--tRNA ligase [Holosporales bacterium]